jgi:hypothetical protein
MIGKWLRGAIDYLRTPHGVPDEVSRSIREEIEFHLAERARQQMRDGAEVDEACQTAVAQFGDVEGVVRGCHQAAGAAHARWHWAHLGTTAVLLVAVGLLSVWVVRNSGEPPAGEGDVTGRVVDEQGRAVANANVLVVVKTWPKQAYRQLAYVAITRADGSFEIENVYPTDEKYAIQLAVVADGLQLQSTYVDLRDGELEPVQFRLAATEPVTLRLHTTAGLPLEGVEVFPHERLEADGSRHMVYFCSGGSVVRRSDSQGEVSLPYFAPGDAATVFVRLPGGDWKPKTFPVGDSRDIVVTLTDDVAPQASPIY